MSAAVRDVFGTNAAAHTSMKDTLEAKHYSDGVLLRVAQPVADIQKHADGKALERQILYGHPIRQLENTNGLSRDETSGYVGYVTSDALEAWVAPTHRVCVRATFLFDEPSFKCPSPAALSLGSLLTIEGAEGQYARTATGQYAIANHLEPIHHHEPDLAATAAKLIGTPYLWAGNSSFGIDCSGLIQICAQRAGVPCPGDSDQQLVMGQPANRGYQRNDFLFWKGHVALVVDSDTVIHANAGAMATVYEPIKDAIARIAAQGDGPVTAHRRL